MQYPWRIFNLRNKKYYLQPSRPISIACRVCSSTCRDSEITRRENPKKGKLFQLVFCFRHSDCTNIAKVSSDKINQMPTCEWMNFSLTPSGFFTGFLAPFLHGNITASRGRSRRCRWRHGFHQIHDGNEVIQRKLGRCSNCAVIPCNSPRQSGDFPPWFQSCQRP